jgi:hypothetical protein
VLFVSVDVADSCCGLISYVAWKRDRDPHPDLLYLPAGMLGVVPGQLFSDGFEWSPTGHDLWSATSGSMDGRLIAVGAIPSRSFSVYEAVPIYTRTALH